MSLVPDRMTASKRTQAWKRSHLPALGLSLRFREPVPALAVNGAGTVLGSIHKPAVNLTVASWLENGKDAMNRGAHPSLDTAWEVETGG